MADEIHLPCQVHAWLNLIMTVLLPSALARGSESGIYSHKVRTYVRGGSRSGMSRGMSLHTGYTIGTRYGPYVRHTV